MLKVFSKKTNFVLMGIIIGFSIGVSIHQAFGDTTSVPGTLQGDSLTVNMDGQYTNGLIVANGNMLVPNGRVGVHITNGGFADLHVDGTTYITGKTVMGTGSHLPENSSSMLTVEGVMFITGGNGIGSTKGIVSKGSSCAIKNGGTCDDKKQELCIGSVCMNEAQLKAKLQVATLSVIKAGTGEGTVISDPAGINCGSECIHNFPKSTSVKLTATPITGSLFTGWTGDCSSSTSTTCTVDLAEDKNVMATFATTISTYTLSVLTAGTGSGRVTSVPTGIDCGATCSGNFATGATVTLTATPATGSTFAGWSGACTNTTGVCTVTLSTAESVTATFSPSTGACGETITFTYNGSSVTYGTVTGADGKCWMDRNLGATQVATSSTDTASYGHLFQWGRDDDGHQVTTSGTSVTLADIPRNNRFITEDSSPYDWRVNQDDTLWASSSSTNNPCPASWHVPTQTEWAIWVTSAGVTNPATAYSSTLKLPLAGFRHFINAGLIDQGSYGSYWSSSPNGSSAYSLLFYSGYSGGVYPANGSSRAFGFSVRCVKD